MARWGGEEFAFILPHTDLEGARAACERIRTEVASHPFLFEGNILPVTTSIGAAAWSHAADTPEKLISLADKALYQAKEGGRNRTCLSDPAG